MLKFTMTISDNLRERLDTEANKMEVPRITLIRMILNNYFDNQTHHEN